VMRAVLLFDEASLLKEPRDESGFTFRRGKSPEGAS